MPTSVVSLKTASFVLHRSSTHFNTGILPLLPRNSISHFQGPKLLCFGLYRRGRVGLKLPLPPVVGLSGQVLFHKESRLGGTTHNGKDGICKSSCWSNIASSRHEVNDLKVRVSLHVFEDAVCIIYRTAIVALLVKWHQTTSTNMSSRKNPAETHLLRTCKSIEVAVEDLWVYLVLLEHVSCFFTSLRQILRKIYSASECN